LITPEQITNTRVVVDTDVFSFIYRKDPRADFFAPYLLHKTSALSFMSVAELYYGAYKDNWGVGKITTLENAIKNFVILHYDYLVCQHWGDIRKQKEFKGLAMSQSDLWIAAVARRHNCPLATNNGTHFQGIDGLVVISPGFI
jgi:tRNA(fMet)-specific endonuclease VapC